MEHWLLRSNDGFWWRDGGRGYTACISGAGLFTKHFAEGTARTSYGEHEAMPLSRAMYVSGMNAKLVAHTKMMVKCFEEVLDQASAEGSEPDSEGSE